MNKWSKAVFVVVGAVVFSTVAIQASDLVRNIDGSLSGLVIESEGICGAGATPILLGSGTLCVDVYEASAGTNCPVPVPTNQLDTQANLNTYECSATSKVSVQPWKFVSLTQAQQLCARSGKRLPTNDEWFALSVATGDQSSCIINGSDSGMTGTPGCVTQSGVYDMVGNLWEWIDVEIYDGQYNQRQLPESGYVQIVDSDGIVIETSTIRNAEYGDDYATIQTTGVRGMVRGGYYGSGTDAGIYAQNISVPLDIKAKGIGFRCVKSL